MFSFNVKLKSMNNKSILILILLVVRSYALDFYPLPQRITNHFQIIPFFGVNYFNNLNLDSDGGSVNSILNTYGLRLKWGEPFEGIAVQYEYINSYVSSGQSNVFSETKLTLDSFKVRYSKVVIQDEFGQVSLFTTLGQLNGKYEITTSSESNGINGYKVRFVTALVGDVGATFVYMLNNEWYLFFEAAYQISANEAVTNLAGDDVSQTGIDFNGASINIGTSLEL